MRTERSPLDSLLPGVGAITGHQFVQLAFLAPIGVLLALLGSMPHTGFSGVRLPCALALIAAATLAVFVVPWSRLPAVAPGLVPVVDFVAVGLLPFDRHASATATLVVLPALWLAAAYRWRGVVAGVVCSVAVLVLPALPDADGRLDAWLRAVMLPSAVTVVAVCVAFMATAWDEQQARLAESMASSSRGRQLTDAIVSTVDVGLLAIGPDGSYEWMNPQQREYLKIVFPQGHEGTAGQLGHVYAADNTTPLAYQQMPSIRAVNGESFSGYLIWVGVEEHHRRAHSVSARPVFTDEGVFDGAVLAYQDVTDLMRALAVKDQFVASVSHELRTPLTSISGYLELAEDHGDELPDAVRHYLSVATRNTHRLLLLVSDLLTTAQFAEGGMRLNRVPMDVAEVVQSSVAGVAAAAHGAGVSLVAHVDQVPPVVADSDRMAQVTDNLLSNAIKYTPAGGTVEVRLSSAADSPTGHQGGQPDIVLTVADSGIGIPDEEQERLFSKFFRASSAEQRAIPGVGLGLVICKEIVEAHGGTIALASTEGSGTTVTVRLPAHSAGRVGVAQSRV